MTVLRSRPSCAVTLVALPLALGWLVAVVLVGGAGRLVHFSLVAWLGG